MSKRIANMLESIAKIERYSTGLSFERCAEDECTVNVVMRNPEILGEAARQIPPEVREGYPEIPWRRVIGLRNIVAHEYFATDPEVVWTLVQRNLRELSQALRRM